MIKIKSISKRALALMLAILTMLSCGIISAVAANVELVPVGATPSTLYLVPNSNWKTDSARFAAYFFGNGETWISMTDSDGDGYYEVAVPSGYTQVIFCRMNPSASANNWNNKWNQTGDLTIPTDGKNCFTVPSGAWDGSTSSWSTYVPTPSKPTSISAVIDGAYGGTGTEADPYKVAPNSTLSIIVSGTQSGAVGLGYNINYAASPQVISGTSVTNTKETAPALDTTKTFDIYLWAYNGSSSTPTWSTEYLTKKIYVIGANDSVTATFKDWDGTQIGDVQTITSGGTPTAPADPTREGYTFTGWSPEVGAITANTTYTAQYTINSYAISVSVNNSSYGSALADPDSVTHGGQTVLSAEANHGYVFSYWEKDGANYSSDNPLTISNITVAQEFKAVFVEAEKHTVTITNNDKYGSFTVSVNGASQTTSGGTYTAELYSGDTISITSGSTTHYYVSSATINGDEYAENSTYFPNNLWTFVYNEKVTGDLTISIVHSANPVLSIGATTNGTLTLSQSGSLSYKLTGITYTATANTGYYVSKISDNHGKVYYDFETDGVVSSVKTGTLDALAQDTTITAEFAAKTVRNLTASAGDGGTVTPTTATGYDGDTVTFTASPSDGYAVEKWTVDGVDKQTGGTTFALAVSGDNKVKVTFTEDKSVRKIYLHTNYNWSAFNAYAWIEGGDKNAEFPGKAMTNLGTDDDGNKLYYIEIDPKFENIIFAQASGTQTSDISIPTDRYTLHYDLVGGENGWFVPGVETIKIYLDNGADKHYRNDGTKSYSDIGLTTVSTTEDSVISLSDISRTHRYDNGNMIYYDTGYYSADVIAGQQVTITNTIQSNATEYEVDGFVINGKEFVEADYMGNGVYTASYSFTEEGTVVVPIYSYTDTYLNAEGLTEIALYAQRPADVATDWGDYMAAYVWYDNPDDSTDTDYMFGSWPGQIMIPVKGHENYWYTVVTSTSANDYPASGITFSNYGGWGDTTGVMYPVTNTTNIQVYDYYEFVTLASQNVDNITFVLKKGEGDNGSGSGITITDTYFTDYVDVSGNTIDVYGKKIAEDAEIGLYVIRNAPVASTEGNLSGYYYVECSLYKPDGTYIGKCMSYELLAINDLATKLNNTYLAGLSGKRVRVDYEIMTNQKSPGNDQAIRYDGQWYNAVVEAEISVNVALTTDRGANYTVTPNTPANSDIYGSAVVGGGEVYVAERGDKVTLSAIPGAGHKFIGWYSADGTRIATSSTTIIDAVIDAEYTAVFQALADDEFIVTHEIYKGGGNSAYIPDAHGGKAKLYIGIVNNNTGETFAFAETEQGSVSATEGDVLTITIGTDPLGVNKFFSWYIDAVDKYGLTTYEEVGIDNYDGTGQYGNLYDNGVDTVEGSSDLVRFQFNYTVKEDIFNIALYSDVVPKSANAKLIYKYENRYGEERTVVVPYVLTDDEIAGCEGNGYLEMTPTQQTIYDKAPYIEDFYKDSTWKITDALYNEITFELWATQPDTVYTVTINAGGSVSYASGTFNTEVEINARDKNPTLTNSGFWYIDNAPYYQYDEGIDQILSYGVYYGLRITDNMMIGYQTVDELEFDVLLGEAEYGREQNTDTEGGNKTDIIYIDYIESFLVPYFNGDTTEDGKKINGVYYGGETIATANTSVTLETLEKLGYTFDYGLIFEQLNPNIVGTEEASAVAVDSTLQKVASGEEKGFVDNTNSKYYTIQSAKSNFFLTNKNRLLFTIKMDNTAANRNKYYNVYGYLAVTDTTGTTSYYFSNQQTLCIKEIGESLGNQQAPDANS